MEFRKYVIGGVITLILAGITLGATTRSGQRQMKVHRLLDSVVIVGAAGTSGGTQDGAIATGTGINMMSSNGYLTLFYQATQATSTPHYRIDMAFSPNNATYTTAVGGTSTVTDTVDEVDTTFKCITVMHPATNGVATMSPWIRFDVVGAPLNAAGTVFDMWIIEH